MTDAAFIWAKDLPEQRLSVVAFRFELQLASVPLEVPFQCFANSHYHLHVNGASVGYGPARSMPSDPSFDAYDLAPFLQKGENVIAVLVAHTAGYSFHHIPMPGAFVAWGNCGEINLSTDSELWSCCVSEGHDVNPPRWSFAVPVIEICDERKWPQGWNQVGKPQGHWSRPVQVDKSGWGELVPREMPALSNDALQAQEIVQAYTHSEKERIHGFRIVHDFALKELPYTKANTCAYTWIYSDSEQSVTAGTWWGDYYINGEKVEQQDTKPDQYMRNDATLHLNKGWNLFFAVYGMTHASWELQLALPAELTVDANRGEGESIAFYASQTLPADQFAELFNGAPANTEYLSQLPFEWRAMPHETVSVSPERRLAWAIADQQLDLDEDCPYPIQVAAKKATSIIVDFGRIALGRLCLDIDAPAGTIFDIYYAEELKNGRPFYEKNCVSYTADRRIAAGSGRLEWFFPRGCKYVEISVAAHDSDVQISDISIIEMRYPYSNDGSFTCSDPRLTTLWEYGVEALRNCSEDVITDCPWRERTMYGGDMLVEMAVGSVFSRDLRLVRRCIDVYLQSQHPELGGLPGRAPTNPTDNPLGEYQLMIVLAASWHLRLTGDIDFAERIADKISFVMKQFSERDTETGLHSFNNTFIEHTKTQKSGLVCAGNACLAGSYRAYGDFLERLGRQEEADAARADAAGLDAAINKTFWDADKTAYKSGVGDPDAPGNPYQLHASFYPGCFASTTEDIDQALEDYYPGALLEIANDPSLRTDHFKGRQDKDFSPYGAFYMLQHLSHMQRADIAEDLILRFYSVMLRHPTGTIWEQFYSGKSLCHAWSAAPTWYASTNILGVQMYFDPSEDVEAIHIQPQSDSVTWAKGAVPHPLGDVLVDWRINGDALHLYYEAPEGVTVHIEPRGKLAELRLIVETVSNDTPSLITN